MSKVAPLLAVLLIGIAAGYLLKTATTAPAVDTATPEWPGTQPRRAAVDDRRNAPGASIANTERRQAANAAPPDSLLGISRLDSEFEQNLALYQLMVEADAGEILRRIDEALMTITGSDQRAAIAMLLSRLAELDATAGLSWILEHPGFHQQSWLHSLFFTWARMDPTASQAAAEALPPHLRQIAGSAYLTALNGMDIAQRERLAQAFGLQSPPLDTSMSFQDNWNALVSLGTGGSRQRQLQTLISRWSSADPEAAWQAAASLTDPRMKSRLQQQVGYRWAQADPEAAIELFLSDRSGTLGDDVIQYAFSQLAATDTNAAFLKLDSLPARLRQSAQLGMARSVIENNRSQVLSWIDGSTDDGFKRSLYQTLLESSLRADATSVDLAWIDQLKPEDALSAESYAISALASSQPEATARRVEQINDPARRSAAITQLSRRWAQRDGQAAADWLNQVGGAERADTTRNLIRGWASSDLPGAMRYLERLPSGEARDDGWLTVIRSARSASEIERALASIEAPEKREQAVMSAYNQLRALNLPGADRYENDAEAIRNRLLQEQAKQQPSR